MERKLTLPTADLFFLNKARRECALPRVRDGDGDPLFAVLSELSVLRRYIAEELR